MLKAEKSKVLNISLFGELEKCEPISVLFNLELKLIEEQTWRLVETMPAVYGTLERIVVGCVV